jgi:hypothetical protein
MLITATVKDTLMVKPGSYFSSTGILMLVFKLFCGLAIVFSFSILISKLLGIDKFYENNFNKKS